MSSQEIQAVCLAVIQTLETLGIDYEIGGSLASSLQGAYRATADADLVANLRPEQVKRFVELLGDGYYANPEAISKAVRQKRSFNIIHLETMLKVDIFAVKETPFAKVAFARRRQVPFFDVQDRMVWCGSPEDVILNKLIWYAASGKVSDRQWLDVRGVLGVQKDALDRAYMEHWAAELGVLALLKKAFEEAGL